MQEQASILQHFFFRIAAIVSLSMFGKRFRKLLFIFVANVGLLHRDRVRHGPQEHQGGVPRGQDLRGDPQLPALREQERAGPGANAGHLDEV